MIHCPFPQKIEIGCNISPLVANNTPESLIFYFYFLRENSAAYYYMTINKQTSKQTETVLAKVLHAGSHTGFHPQCQLGLVSLQWFGCKWEGVGPSVWEVHPNAGWPPEERARHRLLTQWVCQSVRLCLSVC